MKRRAFFKGLSIVAAIPVIGSACTNVNEITGDGKLILQKVKEALLSMQRASWEQGVAAQAFFEIGDEEMATLMAYEAVLRQTDEGRLSVLYTDNGVTDPAAIGEVVFHAYSTTKDESLLVAANKMMEYLLHKAPRTPEGIIYHTLNAPEIWIDSIYMAPPFLAVMGQYNEAVKQIAGIRKCLWNSKEKLYSHRWHYANNEFINESFWGVGNGWALVALSKVINTLPQEMLKEKEALIASNIEHLESCIGYMRADGLYNNVINDSDTFIETNLSQMIAYTIYSGVRSGWLDSSYLEAADTMRKAAHSKVDEYGFVQDVCGAPWFNEPGRAAEGQAFFIMMEAARNKLL